MLRGDGLLAPRVSRPSRTQSDSALVLVVDQLLGLERFNWCGLGISCGLFPIDDYVDVCICKLVYIILLTEESFSIFLVR